MPRRQSRMLELGTPALAFELADGEGVRYRVAAGPGARPLLVAFLCNHCPYVVHLLSGFVAFAREYGPRGVDIVAISANDPETYPADAPQAMAELARREAFPFPYLYDETQDVARAYGAVCTPDFFLFGADRRLVYRGQFDDSRPGQSAPVTGSDLRAAVDAILAGGVPDPDQRPSVGCSIKWRAGHAPDWA